VLPPKLAPFQVVIIPIFKNEEQLSIINEKVQKIKKGLENKGITVKYDNRDNFTPGWKFSEYEFKGVPIRMAIGPRDIENDTVEVARRDTLEKAIYQIADIENKIDHLLEQIQKNLYQKALNFREENSYRVDDWEEFQSCVKNKGGFIYAHWDGTPETEQQIKELTKATIRCIPLNNQKEKGKCIYSGQPSSQRVVFAKAY
jgi:prolyl-tRNA synthetase